jgi:hypothetical protein
VETEDIDIDDLRNNTVYAGFDESSDTIRMFWDVVRSFAPDQKSKLLKFVTSRYVRILNVRDYYRLTNDHLAVREDLCSDSRN